MPDQAYLPPHSDSVIGHVGGYRRVLPVNLDRMFENAIDWAHLPYLHDTSFAGIECVDAGPWGWRAEVANHDGSSSTLELLLDRRQRRWVTRNLGGPNEGAEIWTYVIELGAREIEIFVDFFVPGVPPEAREKVGRAYAAAYERLYDEDERMMVQRQAALDLRVESANRSVEAVSLGRADGLTLPLSAQFDGRGVIVDRVDGQLVVYPDRCPHMLAPLEGVAPRDGILTCPWHGYAFDLRSGACVSGHNCELRSQVSAVEKDGDVLLVRA